MKEIIKRSARYILSLQDKKTGGFRFASGNKATVMGTAYAIHCLEFLGSLNMLTEEEKNKTIGFLMKCCKEDGIFRDPLFNIKNIATKQHDEAYFDGETTCFAQNTLDALGAPPPGQRLFPKRILSKKGLIEEFESYDWKDPHLNSNRVMFWMAQFAHEIEKHKKVELLELIDAGLDWLDKYQSSRTGLWSGPYKANLSAAMAATFHFTFFYSYRDRPLRHPERIIDSCLELQKPDGLFSRGADIGQTCLDYDAIDLLAKASLITDYRFSDVQDAFQNAQTALLMLLNDDGGFANVKHLQHGGELVASKKLYHTGLDICSCSDPDSNSFSTWFRLLAYYLTQQDIWKEYPKEDQPFIFRRLPWLGCHDVEAIKQSYFNSQKRRFGLSYITNDYSNRLVYRLNDPESNLAKTNGLYHLKVPLKISAFIFKIKIKTKSALTAKLSIRSKTNTNKYSWQNLSENIQPTEGVVYFGIRAEQNVEDAFLDFYGDEIEGRICRLELIPYNV